MESDYHWLVAVALITSSVIAVTANAFLLVIFARRRSLRTVPNRFVINLLVTNLLSSLLLIPLLVVDQNTFQTSSNVTREFNETQIEERRLIIKEEIGRNLKIFESSEKIIEKTEEQVADSGGVGGDLRLCYFAQASTSFVCTASIFSILLIGINQYFGVIHSLRYHFYINKARATLLIAATWLAALVCAVFSTATYSDGSLWHVCAKKQPATPTTKALNTVYAFSYFVLVILAPFIAICVIYLCIYTAAHRNSERMRKSTSSSSSNAPLDSLEPSELRPCMIPKVHSAPNFSSLEAIGECAAASVKRTTSSDRNSFITNLKHKISNASVFRYREETRAAKISVIVILMVLVCYVPYGLTLVLTSSYINVSPGQIFNYLSLVLLVFSNVISPFLFGYRNKRVKREIGKMVGIIPSTQHSPFTNVDAYRRHTNMVRNRSFAGLRDVVENATPLMDDVAMAIPEVVVTCKPETERKSILKRVGSGWGNYKKCNFIAVPESCLGDARGSFSSASTQVSTDD